MKKILSKLTEKRLLYKFTATIFITSIISSRPVMTFLNDWWTSSNGALFKINISFFYSNHFNDLAYASMAIVIGIFIPAFISLYSNAKSSNKISQFFIKENFKVEEFIIIVVLVTAGTLSKNSVFIFIIYLIASFVLIIKMHLYMKFLFNTKHILISFLRQNFETHTQAGVALEKTAERLELILNQHFPSNDEYNPSTKKLYFRSNGYVENFSTRRLKEWLERVSSSLIEILPRHEEFSQPISIKEKVFANVIYSPRDIFLAVRINIDSDIDKETFSKWQEKHFTTLRKSFESDIFSYGDYPEDYHDLLSSLDVYIYTLLKQNNYSEFVETINFIKEMIEDDTFPKDNLAKLSFMNYHLFNIYNDFEKNSATSYHFYDYWRAYFEMTYRIPDENAVNFAWNDLANAIKHGIFLERELNELDRTITSFQNFNILTPDYVHNYLNGLISVIVSFATENHKRESEILKFINFIKYLRDDFSETSFYASSYPPDDKKEIHNLANDALLILTFYIDQEVLNLDQEFKDKLYQNIQIESFLDTVQRVYLQMNDKWKISRWRDHHFDRHGMGSTWSFSRVDMLIHGMERFTQINNYNSDIFENVSISHKALHLFKEFEKKIGLKATDDFNTNVKNFIIEGINLEALEIINSTMDSERIDKFITGCTNAYKGETKYCNFFESKSVSELAPDDSIGQHLFLDKDTFIKEKSVSLSGLYDLGRYLAFNETAKITKQIIGSELPIKVGIDEFYNAILPKLITSDKLVLFVGRTYNLYSSAFSWSSDECLFNPSIKKIHGNVKNDGCLKLRLEVSSKDIHLLNSPNLEANFVIVCSPTDIFIEYRLPESKTTELNWIKDNNIYFKITDFSKDENLTKTILEKNEYKQRTDDNLSSEISLKTKLDFKLYVTPRVIVKEKKDFQIYQIPFPINDE